MRKFFGIGALFLAGAVLGGCDLEKPPLKAVPAAAPKVPVLKVPRMHEKMRVFVDGKVADLAWKELAGLEVALEGEGVNQVTLKAVHDGEYLYMLALWPDSTKSFNRYWEYVGPMKWKKHVGEDAFSICWSPGALQERFREQGCALFCHASSGRHVFVPGEGELRGTDFADFWYWGAQQTGAKQSLRDMRLPFGDKQRLRGDSQGENSDNILNLSDEGYQGPWGVPKYVGKRRSPFFLDKANTQPLKIERLKKLNVEKNIGWKVALDIQRGINGSRADVAARAQKAEKVWVLEMRRKLNTGSSDDQILNPDAGVPVLFSVAVHDGTEKGAHTVSGPIEMQFVTRQWAAGVGRSDNGGK